MKFKEKIKQVPKSWYFLLTIIIAYLLLSIFNQKIYLESWNFFNQIILKIAPIFLLVFVLMTLSNFLITPEFVVKHLKEKGIKKWFFVIIGGIISSGPIYMWYPLLADLRNKGLNYGLIACFLYNRAIKIPLLPLMIIYFNWKYIFILTIIMIIISIIQGILLNKLMEVK
jgi:uncharacterized membrane protein YraQ (UPF0718 family)